MSAIAFTLVPARHKPTLEQRVAALPHLLNLAQRADARWAAHAYARFLLRKCKFDALKASAFAMDKITFRTAMKVYCVPPNKFDYAQKVCLEHLVKEM